MSIELVRSKPKAPLGFKVAGGIDKPYSGAKFDSDGIYVSFLEKRYAWLVNDYPKKVSFIPFS